MVGKLTNGRGATGIPHTSRSRLQKIATEAIATKIQDSGGDATVTAVLRELKETEIKDLRKATRFDRPVFFPCGLPHFTRCVRIQGGDSKANN